LSLIRLIGLMAVTIYMLFPQAIQDAAIAVCIIQDALRVGHHALSLRHTVTLRIEVRVEMVHELGEWPQFAHALHIVGPQQIGG
jgi:hypothetical protein